MTIIPFAKIDLAVLFDKNLSSRDKVLYAILCALPYKKEGIYQSCQATILQLSTLLHRSERTVQESLKALSDRGVICRIPQYKMVEVDGQMIRRQIASKFIIIGCRSNAYPETEREGYHFSQISPDILNQNLPVTAKWLFMVLSSMSKMDSICTYIRTLANKMRIAISTVKKALKILREQKLIDITNNFVGQLTQGKLASSYALAPQLVDNCNMNVDNGMNESENLPYLVSNSSPLRNNRSYIKNTNISFANAKDGTAPSSQNSDTLTAESKPTEKINLDRILPILSPTMREVIRFLSDVTNRDTFYEKEIHVLVNNLDKHDTPRRIKEEICRVAERFMKNGKDLKNLTLSYIWQILRTQPATFGEEITANQAKKAIAEERTEEQQRRKDLLEARYAQPQTISSKTSKKLDWINPVSETNLSEAEAQTIIADLEQQPIFKDTDKLIQTAIKQKQQEAQDNPERSVPATASLTVSESQDAVKDIAKEQVFEYLDETLASELKENDTTAEKVFENTVKNMTAEELQAKLKQIWSVKTQAHDCANCICCDVNQCQYHGLKHGLFISHRFSSHDPLLFFSRDKCEILIEAEKQAKERQIQQLFAEAVCKSGLTSEHTFTNYQTDSSLKLLNAKATAMKAVQTGEWILFSGRVGCGKTHIAQAIGVSMIAQSINKGLNPLISSNSVVFTTAKQVLNRLWEDFKFYDSRMTEYKNCKILILDELGRENNSPRASKDLFEILNARYAKGLQTIFTSNLTLEQLVRHNPTLYKPVLSRLAEKGTWVSLYEVEDYRPKCTSADASAAD